MRLVSRVKARYVLSPLLFVALVAGLVQLVSMRAAVQAVGATSQFPPKPREVSTVTALHCGSGSIVPSPNHGARSNVLVGVAAISAINIWAVGTYLITPHIDHTLIEHWNGTRWWVIKSPNVVSYTNYLSSVAALSWNDVWAVGSYRYGPYAVGQTLIEHWDGTSWSVVPSPSPGLASNYLVGIAVVSSTDVWAVGSYQNSNMVKQPLIEHWDGTSWNVIPGPKVGQYGTYLSSVAVVSSNDVWAVGAYYYSNNTQSTLIEHWNGTSWSVVPSPNVGSYTNYLSSVAVVSSNDVWAVGAYYYSNNTQSTLIEHWNGTSWNVFPSTNIGAESNTLYGVAVRSANDVWVLGGAVGVGSLIEHWNGTSWNVFSQNAGPVGLGAVAVFSARKVVVVGNYAYGAIRKTLIEIYYDC